MFRSEGKKDLWIQIEEREVFALVSPEYDTILIDREEPECRADLVVRETFVSED